MPMASGDRLNGIGVVIDLMFPRAVFSVADE